ncbi:hypothetical protein VCRA2133E348_620023 [Vibrio crassostreae]|nr:hypothetical protein VCRA2133E348_620023 [Vibrio crassostreae]CAK3590652.1 hypothetical protein VCRA213O314_650024 [Vibrio crassostreae]
MGLEPLLCHWKLRKLFSETTLNGSSMTVLLIIVKVSEIIDEQALDYLAEHLTTLLQFEQHLTAAMEEALIAAIKPINVKLLTEIKY